MYTIEVFHFPTQVVLIDDDPAFLKALSSKLSEKFLVKTFNHPQAALDYLNSTQPLFNIIHPNVLVNEEQEYGERYLNLSKMNTLAESTQKREMTTVVISDYIMPDMNGIEFFQKIAEMPVMKILLTGNADLDLALYAFNRGIVNKFIVKKSKKLLEDVEEAITICQRGFFTKFSYPILNSLNLPSDSLLRQPELFIQLEKIIQENDVVEYYLIDNIGSHLLITNSGKRIYFMCLTERQFDEYADIALNGNAPIEIIEQLKKRTHAPVFIKESDYRLAASEWRNIMHSFEKKDKYYFFIKK